MVLEPAGAGELVERRLGQLMAWLPDLISGTEASPGHLPQGITVFSLLLIFRVRGFFLEIVPGACVQLCYHLGVCVCYIRYNKGPCNWEQYKQQYLEECALRLTLYQQNSTTILLFCQETLPHIK